jgi:large subunit ribosomal protein L14
MIQQKTTLKVSDNSGAKTVKCLKILGGFKKKYSKLGEIVVISIQQLRNKSKKTSKVKKKEIYKALIIKTKATYRKRTGYKKFFKKNTVTLLNKQGNPIGTRILEPLPQNLKKKKLQKFISISTGLI